MPHRHRFFSNREWVARGVVTLVLGSLIVSAQVVHLKPPPLVKPPAKPLKITLAAPEPTPVPPTPAPPQPVEPPPPPPPEPTPVEPPPPPPPIPAPAPKPIEPPPPPPKPVEKPKPVQKSKPVKPVHHEKKHPPKHKQPPKPVAKPEPVKEPAPQKPVTPAKPAPVAPVAPVAPPAPASNPSHEAAYVSQVRRQIEHHKIYPALARRLDMSGTVEVAYVLNRQGKLLSVRIVKSSGSDILDKAALQAVHSALFPPIPEDAWRGDAQKQFRTSLVYSLSDN